MDKMIIDNDTFFADVLRLLDQGKQVTIPVKGFSMLPFIRGGKDLVVLEKAGEVLRADDIVLFHVGPREGGRYVMHRILSIDGDAVDIQGDGVPKIHEHDNKPPQLFALIYEGRIVCIFTYECDLGDGWEDPGVHNDSQATRLKALQMGENILQYTFTH